MDSHFDGIALHDTHEDAYRNIVSLRESQDLFDDLSDSSQGWQAASELEMQSKPATYTSHQPIIHRPFEEADFNAAIHYPFSHWSMSRYSAGDFGVWYGADELTTTIYETVNHWRAGLLRDAGWQDMEGLIIERKVYLVRIDAALLDFRQRLETYPALIDPNSYHLTHQVGARIHHDGHPGLLSRSARCAGNIAAIFNQQVLSQPRDYCFLTYRIRDKKVRVERQPDELLLQI